MNMELKSMLFVLLASLCSGIECGSEGEGGGGVPKECVQKLIVCEPYLKGSTTPPASCCVPLKDMIAKDPACLCSIFNNPSFLKSLNITQHDALHLPKACGANADISVCKKLGAALAPSTPPSTNTPSTPPSTNTPSNSTKGSGNSTVRAIHKNAACKGVTVVSFIMPLLIISVFLSK